MDRQRDLNSGEKEGSLDKDWCRITFSKNKPVEWGYTGFLPSFFFALAFVPDLLVFLGLWRSDGLSILLLDIPFLLFAFSMGIMIRLRNISSPVNQHAANIISFVLLLATFFMWFIGSSSVIKRSVGNWCYQLLFSVVLILFLSDAVRFWLRKPPLIRIPIWLSTTLFVVSFLCFVLWWLS